MSSRAAGALRRGLGWATGLLALASVAASLGALGWPFELFSHFRVQGCAAGLLVAALALALRRPLLAGVALAITAPHAIALWPAPAAPTAARAVCDGPVLELVTANVHFRNTDQTRLLHWLRSDPPDLLVVQELNATWAASLQQALPTMPYGAQRPRGDAYGIALLSATPLVRLEELDLAGDGLPSMRALWQTGEGERAGQLEVLAVHARWPLTPRLLQLRNQALATLTRRAGAVSTPLVLVGDLNLTPYAPGFRQLLEDSGLHDAGAGRGWRPTWLAAFWPLALRIDHVLVSPGVCVESLEVGPPIGSDHRPLRARLRLPLTPR